MKIVITGAARGIGLQLTQEILAEGHEVLAVVRDSKKAMALKKLKGELKIIEADVTEEKSGARVAKAVAKWGSLDLLINNAGVYPEGTKQKDFLQAFRVNSIAPFQMTEALLPILRKAGEPKAVFITSMMGSIGDNSSGGSYAYRASKAALNMIVKTFTQDERWLTTAVVHPGWVQTAMGGPHAPTPVKESAQGIWTQIKKLKRKDSGCFIDFEGNRLPW